MYRKLALVVLAALVTTLPAAAQQATNHKSQDDDSSAIWPSDIVAKQQKPDGTCYVVTRNGTVAYVRC